MADIFLILAAVLLLGVHVLWKLWQGRLKTREVLQDRERWLLQLDAKRATGGEEDRSEIPAASQRSASEPPSGPRLRQVPCSSEALHGSETPRSSSSSSEAEPEPSRGCQAGAAVPPPVASQPSEAQPASRPRLRVGQVRRSISEALRAIEPSGETCDELLEHLEQSLLQVELSKSHAVLLKRAEVHLLTLLGALRDVLSRSLGLPRQRLSELQSCARASRLRAVLDALRLSPGRQDDDRLRGCGAALDAVEGVLKDLGLQDTLRRAQEEKRIVLKRALEQKLQEEKQLKQSPKELRMAREEQRKALAEALRDRVDEWPAEEALVRPAVADFARGDASMWNWFLDYAEGLLTEVLCWLDGGSLLALESASGWPRRLCATSLPGVWRYVHLCSLGARPPVALARAPRQALKGSGPWKQLWLARRQLLSEADATQRRVAFEQARLLMSPGSHGVVQPMKPQERFLPTALRSCLPDFQQDPRFGPLQERWCSHLMVGTEAMVTHDNGVQTNHEQLYMSWSVCFSAHQGLPRLFLASARKAHQLWEVDLAECRLPAKAPLPWAAAAQEIHELRAAGRALQLGLCDGKELCSFQFQGPDWLPESVQLAPKEHWQQLHKELLGSEWTSTGTRTCLQLLLALTCPKPFAEEPERLVMALEGLQSSM